jgi:hypothetical protein
MQHLNDRPDCHVYGKTGACSESIHSPSRKRHSQRVRQQKQRLDAPINDIAHLEAMRKKRDENRERLAVDVIDEEC